MKKLFLLAAAASLGIVTCGCSGNLIAKPYFYVKSHNSGYFVAINDTYGDAAYITKQPMTIEKAKELADKLNKDAEESGAWTAEECGRR